MPIKFKCQCGQVLNVSSKLAGKTGKCPKCAKSIKIPTPKVAGSPAASGPSKQPQAKGAAAGVAKASGSAASGSAASGSAASGGLAGLDGLDSLFDDAGLVQKSGPTCSNCRKDIKPGTVICTSCGFNFETGELMTGFDAKASGPEFDNPYLQDAAENMRRDILMDSRRDKAAMPWWVIMSFLIGAVTLCAAGVVIVDGKFGTPDPENTFIGKIQRWPVFTTLGLTALVTGLAITVFAHMSITFFAFTRSMGQGFACFFLPLLYSIVYGIMNWIENKAPVKAIMMALVFIAIGVFFIIQGGGFGLVMDAFK